MTPKFKKGDVLRFHGGNNGCYHVRGYNRPKLEIGDTVTISRVGSGPAYSFKEYIGRNNYPNWLNVEKNFERVVPNWNDILGDKSGK